MILEAVGTVVLPCAFLNCTNAARYITVDGRLACATCPVQHKVDAIKIASVPELLALVRAFLQWGAAERVSFVNWDEKFRWIVGPDASKP